MGVANIKGRSIHNVSIPTVPLSPATARKLFILLTDVVLIVVSQIHVRNLLKNLSDLDYWLEEYNMTKNMIGLFKNVFILCFPMAEYEVLSYYFLFKNSITRFFFFIRTVYKNVEAEIFWKLKNILRTRLVWKSKSKKIIW